MKPQSKLQREFSAGGVVYKRVKELKSKRARERDKSETKERVLWLVTASSPSHLFPKSSWRLPKGWLDDEGPCKPGKLTRGVEKATDNILQETAIREVKEEGGVKAKIISKVGTEKYFLTLPDRRALKFVTFFLMEWQKDEEDGFGFETKEISWLPYKEAYKRLSYYGEKQILEKAYSLLGSIN